MFGSARKLGLAGFVAGSALLIAASAGATPITFDLDQGSLGNPALTHYGVVSLDQGADTNTVHVNLDLDPGVIFAVSGAGDALTFNVTGAISILNITSGFGIGPAPDSSAPFGAFLASVTCTTGCGNGTSPPQNPGPLDFDVVRATGLSPTDFIANAGGFFFASDIGAPKPGGFDTGNVAADNANITIQCTPGVDCVEPFPVPEPSTLAMFGLGLFGLGWMLRRRAAA
jgi:hypothetical protein